MTRAVQRLAGLLLLCSAACLLQQSAALVTLPKLPPWGLEWQPPVTSWLLSKDIPQKDQLAWRKLGAKVWAFLEKLDNDFVDATGQTVPPSLATQRIFGPAVKCGRFARMFIRMPFHDCGTFDVGDTGSVGSIPGVARFGCNGSLRWELAPCDTPGPQCVGGFEAAIDLTTGAFLPESAFQGVINKYGADKVQVGFDAAHPRAENTGFQNALAFFYQLKLETEQDEPAKTRLATVSLADIIMYAGMLAVAKCQGPQVVFEPGRTDSAVFDAPKRLPDPTEELSANIAYFWANGLSNFDMVNLLAAHTTACFSVGCMDATPSLFDSNWAQQILTVNTPTDPRICQFVDGKVPAKVVPMCFLPSDVEFNTRADVRAYLLALTGQTPVKTAAATYNPCVLEPGLPADVGTCGGVPFVPFTLARTRGGSVNLCSRRYDNWYETVGCARDPPNKAFLDIFATSYFKMSKLYTDASGAIAGARWGVAVQPCTPGLIQIGFTDGPSPPNPKCACCPTPLPQDFSAIPHPPATPPAQSRIAASAQLARNTA